MKEGKEALNIDFITDYYNRGNCLPGHKEHDGFLIQIKRPKSLQDQFEQGRYTITLPCLID